MGQLAGVAAPRLRDPDLHRSASIGGERDRPTVRRPRRIGVDRRVVREPPRRGGAVDRHQPEIAERREHDPSAVGRNRWMRDAGGTLRPGDVEPMTLRSERRSRERHVGAELDRPCRAAGGRPPFDPAVRRVQQFVVGDPLRPERKHVFVGVRDVAAVDDEPAAAARNRVERDRSVRTERWSGERAVGGGDQLLVRIDSGLLSPIGHVGDFGRAAPRRHELVGGCGRDRSDLAGGKRHRPDVVAAAAIRRERDAQPVGRPHRLAIVERARRDGAKVAAVGVDGPDLPRAAAIRLEGDLPSVRRPRWLARVHEDVGDGCRGAAVRRHRPQRAEQIDRNGAPVGRERGRHVRSFAQREMHLATGARLKASRYGLVYGERFYGLVYGERFCGLV